MPLSRDGWSPFMGMSLEAEGGKKGGGEVESQTEWETDDVISWL